MAAGKKLSGKNSPIINAIAMAEEGTTGEIRVHISRRWFERDAFGRAQKLFKRFGMGRTAQRNAVLIYVNLRRKKYAIIGDEGIHKAVGADYWEGLSHALGQDLSRMPAEKAIALAVCTVGATLQKYFPIEIGAANPNELVDEVTED